MERSVLIFLLGLAVLLGAARALGEVCRRLGVPAVAGEILAGVVLGKTVLGRVSPAAFTWIFPDGPAKTMLVAYTTVAVMLLLVVAGLEIDLTVVRKSGRVVIITSLIGIILPFVVGCATGQLLPDGWLPDPSRRLLHSAFFGIALAITALPVIAKTLLDLNLMRTDLGMFILSAAVFDDLAGWTGFSVLSQQFRRHAESSNIAVSVLLTAAFVGVVLVVVRPLADRLLGWLQGPDEAATGRALSVIMVMALLGASATEALGMHPVFGGFVMGVAIGDSSRLREHTRQIFHDFVTNVFTPVFFATMALHYDFIASFDLALVSLVVVIACVTKVVGCATGARLAGVAWREATAIGFGMNCRGAMEILLAVLAIQAGIISEKLFVALVVMALVTSLISGPALVRLVRVSSSPVAALLRRGEILLDVQAPGRPELLEAMAAGLAARAGRPGDAALFTAKVLDREQLASTGVGDGVAFPHAEIEGLDRPLLAFARSDRGLDFDAPDGQQVRLVFLLLMPPRDYDRQLQLLSAMARLMTREEVRRALLRLTAEREVLALLDDASRTPLPESAPVSARQRGLAP